MDRIGTDNIFLVVGQPVTIGIGIVGASMERIEGLHDRGTADDGALDNAGRIVFLASDPANFGVHPEVVFPAVGTSVAIGIGFGRIGAVEGARVGVGKDTGVVVCAVVRLIKRTDGKAQREVGGCVQPVMKSAHFIDIAECRSIRIIAEPLGRIGEVCTRAAGQEVAVVVAHAIRCFAVQPPGQFPKIRQLIMVDVGTAVGVVVFATEDTTDLAVFAQLQQGAARGDRYQCIG